MTSNAPTRSKTRAWPLRTAVVLAISLTSLGAVAIGAPATPAASPAPSSGVATFPTPELAAEALAAAWRGAHASDLLRIFGPAGQRLVKSGDHVADRRARERLAADYDARHRLERDGRGEMILVMGDQDWAYPIPIVRRGSGWQFDVKAGAEQILDRRIGRNELNAIAVAHAYVAAQRDYAAEHRLPGGAVEYARQIVSSEGRHDGLYWPAAAGASESPLGPLVSAAEAKGYAAPTKPASAPFQGYYVRILTAQGAYAPGGARNYVVDGHMTGGFALVAFPARWGDSGVMTFVVDQNGIVFEKNLGPDTARLARRMALYDPDRSWKVAAAPEPRK